MGNSWEISPIVERRMQEHLAFLYGAGAKEVGRELGERLESFRRRHPQPAAAAREVLSQADAILITYGDQFREAGCPPLQTLHRVLVETLGRPVSGVHILPFFPYSSDDGFSVVDYARVNAELGTWQDVERLGADFRLMFDAVINHVSRESAWFQGFVAGDPAYTDWFLAFEPDAALDWVPEVVRPRARPLLTPVETAQGKKLVWTTFSDDQIDLNYAHPPVLLKIIEILLHYVEKGAELIRLDAIAYLWKKIGTSCIHLPETHRAVKLLRAVLDAVAPNTLLITETNVPHEENIRYFGRPLPGSDRTDEAQMVYQFPLAPLAMHSLLSGSARAISRWAAGLRTPAPGATFFNFTASHDGIGLMPARGLLTDAEIQALIDTTLAHGGQVSYKTNADGSQSVYELNISYFDALSDPAGGEPQTRQVQRFLASQAIMLALAGVPGIYVHSLVGSRSWPEGVARTGQKRSINRQKLARAELEQALAEPGSLRRQVLDGYRRLLRARAAEPAFHPRGGQRVVSLDEAVLALVRTSPAGDRRVLCLHNVAGQTVVVRLRPSALGLAAGAWRDLVGGGVVPVAEEGAELRLGPYAVRWLKD